MWLLRQSLAEGSQDFPNSCRGRAERDVHLLFPAICKQPGFYFLYPTRRFACDWRRGDLLLDKYSQVGKFSEKQQMLL